MEEGPHEGQVAIARILVLAGVVSGSPAASPGPWILVATLGPPDAGEPEGPPVCGVLQVVYPQLVPYVQPWIGHDHRPPSAVHDAGRNVSVFSRQELSAGEIGVTVKFKK